MKKEHCRLLICESAVKQGQWDNILQKGSLNSLLCKLRHTIMLKNTCICVELIMSNVYLSSLVGIEIELTAVLLITTCF